MKRIAIISHGLSNGGSERVASILANHFAEDGNEVLFIAVHSPEKEYKLNDNVTYVYVNPDGNRKAVKMLRRIWRVDREIKDFRCDIVISFIINETILLNLKHQVPMIYSLRNDPGNLKKKKGNWLMCQFAYSRAKSIVFQTNGARSFFAPRIRNKGVVIGNPLTKDLPYWNSGSHSKVIVTACRLNPQKNLRMLIEGFSKFHASHPEYRLKIYGSGPLETELKQYAGTLGVEDAVDFPGHSTDIHRIMSEAEIFALTSDYEGLSNSMLEALAIGVPTVCTDCPPGGAAEYITSGQNGLLVPVGDADGLAKGLCTLANDEELRKRISREAIQIREFLNEDTVMEQWKKLL